jgi:dihydrodipicolinate synthase/N-acetylneuraminate lyase
MNSVPWWGVPLVAGFFALGGVLLSQLSNFWLERRRVKREDARQWHEHRRELYARFLGLCYNANTYIVTRVKDSDWKNVSRDLLNQVSETRSEIELLASAPLIEAAKEINAALHRLHATRFLETTPASAKDGLNAIQEIDKWRDEFLRHARSELEVQGDRSRLEGTIFAS